MGAATELARVSRERDLYLRLLHLGEQVELEPFLRDALSLIVEAVSALHGYLELHDERGGPGWWIAHGLSPEQVEGVRHAISRGIIAEALATGRTIVTPSRSSRAAACSRDLSAATMHTDAISGRRVRPWYRLHTRTVTPMRGGHTLLSTTPWILTAPRPSPTRSDR